MGCELGEFGVERHPAMTALVDTGAVSALCIPPWLAELSSREVRHLIQGKEEVSLSFTLRNRAIVFCDLYNVLSLPLLMASGH